MQWVKVEELGKKILRMVSLKKIQILNFGRRIACSSSSVTYVSVGRRKSAECCGGSYLYLWRQIFWRLKSEWRGALRGHRRNSQFGYDPRSYTQNFDDGWFGDRPSPLVPL